MIKLPKSNSSNSKLGRGVRATYREVGPTCPQDCEALQTKVCYALYGFVNIHANKSEYSMDDSVRLSRWLAHLPRDQKVRHHVSGDFMKPGNHVDWEYVESMVGAHRKRRDLQGWTYTHAWKKLDSKYMNSAESLTVNASCDNVYDVIKALKKGWPSTLVVSEDTPNKAHLTENVKLVVCPHQTHNIQCSDCMLCFRKNRSCVVGFRVHGTGKSKFLDERRDNSLQPFNNTP